MLPEKNVFDLILQTCRPQIPILGRIILNSVHLWFARRVVSRSGDPCNSIHKHKIAAVRPAGRADSLAAG